jgi:hypothetical protein
VADSSAIATFNFTIPPRLDRVVDARRRHRIWGGRRLARAGAGKGAASAGRSPCQPPPEARSRRTRGGYGDCVTPQPAPRCRLPGKVPGVPAAASRRSTRRCAEGVSRQGSAPKESLPWRERRMHDQRIRSPNPTISIQGPNPASNPRNPALACESPTLWSLPCAAPRSQSCSPLCVAVAANPTSPGQ